MKTTGFLIFVFTIAFSTLKAQETGPAKSFKYIFKANINYYGHPRFGNSSIGNVAPDWVIKNKKGNFHEFELTGISVNRFEYVKHGTQKSSSFSLRYQYDISLIKKDKKIIPFIGFSAMASSNKSNFSSSDTSYFDGRRFNSSVRLGVVPGVYFFPCKNLSVDFSMPLDMASFGYFKHYVAIPNIPSNQQTSSNFDFNTYFLNKLRFRLGIGLRF
jgi:hypothetical protein